MPHSRRGTSSTKESVLINLGRDLHIDPVILLLPPPLPLPPPPFRILPPPSPPPYSQVAEIRTIKRERSPIFSESVHQARRGSPPKTERNACKPKERPSLFRSRRGHDSSSLAISLFLPSPPPSSSSLLLLLLLLLPLPPLACHMVLIVFLLGGKLRTSTNGHQEDMLPANYPRPWPKTATEMSPRCETASDISSPPGPKLPTTYPHFSALNLPPKYHPPGLKCQRNNLTTPA